MPPENPSAENKQAAGIIQNVMDLEQAVQNAGGRKALLDFFGTADVQLSSPFTWCDVTYETIHLDFAALTGVEIESIEDELGAGVSSRNRRYLRAVAARASGVPSDAIVHLPSADYNAVISAAERFFMVSG